MCIRDRVRRQGSSGRQNADHRDKRGDEKEGRNERKKEKDRGESIYMMR